MERRIVEVLKEVTEQFPDRIALVHDDESIPYAQLWQRISQLAGYLQQHGVGRGDYVALIQENSINYVISYYAVLLSGAAVVALNTAAKVSDYKNWLDFCRAKWVIADAKYLKDVNLKDFLQNVSGAVMLGDRVTGEIATDETPSVVWLESIFQNESLDPLSTSPDLNDVAALIYTSGTTGSPKGVKLTHRNLMANYSSVIQYLGLTSSDSIVNVLPFYYSYGNSILHTHLLSGGTVIIENNFMFPQRALEKIAHFKATGFSGVPSTFAILLARTQLERYDLSSLRYVTQAGGAMPVANIERFTSQVPSAEFIVMYGQTEATARLTYLPSAMLKNKMGSVGIPIPGVAIEIRDDSGLPVSHGIEGEVYASGANIMAGYLDNAEATAQVIHDGWLKTGDMGSMDADGYIYLTGRKTDMLKVGGHRISPLEIEEAITELDAVEEVAVVGVPDEILGQIVRAVVVTKKDAELSAREIKAHCNQRLASYKIPKIVDFVEQLPKTVSGKVQRYLL